MTSRLWTGAHGSTSVLLFTREYTRYFIRGAKLITAGLVHGCARVAHCVTARWRNFSHYCRPLRQYDVWFTCSEHREALPGAPTTHGVHKQEFTVQGGPGKYIVRHWTSREASLRHSSRWGTWSVFPQYRDLRTRCLVYSCAEFRYDKILTFRKKKSTMQ